MSYYIFYLSSNLSLNNFTYTYRLQRNFSHAFSPPLFLLLPPFLNVAIFQNSSKHEVFIDPLFHQFPATLMAKHILDKITHTDQMLL